MPHRQPESLRIAGQAKQAFEEANPAIWNKIQGQPVIIQEVKNIHDRTETLMQRMQDHVDQHRQNWVGREAVRLLEEHGGRSVDAPRPSWVSDIPVNFSFLQEARRRVQLRIDGRMGRIAEAGKRMEAQVATDRVPARDHGPRDPVLRQEVQTIINRTQIARNKARSHYAKHRDGWLKNAVGRGSDNPKMEVFHGQQARMQRIDRAGDRLIRDLFQDHNRTLPKSKDTALVQDFSRARE